jgi:hypothetical protein
MASGSGNDSVVKLEGLPECSICLKKFRELRSLPCHHKFCKGCLEKYVESLRDGDNIETFPCPKCPSEFTLKSKDKGRMPFWMFRKKKKVIKVAYLF